METERLDVLLCRRGLFPSRTRAAEAVRAGRVRVGGSPADKPSLRVPADADVTVEARREYVGRGAYKLIAALDAFGVDPAGRVCLDVGSSTGGFTEVWLERGARRVVAVDVGTDQMAPRLRADPRVTLWEQTDVRALSPAAAEDAELCSADVSFLSLLAVLAAGPVRALSRRGGEIVALVKPQFECGPRARDKHGVVRRLSDHVRALNAVADGARALGYRVSGLIPSPITGGDGNVEYLLYLAGTEAAPDAAAVAGEAFRLFRPAGADRSGPKQTTPQSGGKKIRSRQP